MFALPILCLTAYGAPPAWAKNERTSPLSYTTIQTRKQNNVDPEGSMKFRRVEQEKKETAAAPKAEEEDTPAMRVWRKYKALASGQDTEEAAEQPQKEQSQKEQPRGRLHNKSSARAPDMPAAPVPSVAEKQTAGGAKPAASRSEAPRSATSGIAMHTLAPQAGEPLPPSGQSAPPPTGFQSILQEYHRAKEQRRSLHSITVTSPTAPQKPEKPAAPAE